MATDSKSDKYNKAVTRATGGDVESAAPAIPTNTTLVRKVVTKADVDAVMADPSLEFAPQVYSMEQGDLIEGVLEGNGPEAEFERKNEHTGEVTTNAVQTWIIRSHDGRQRISILSSAQLDKKLPPFVGGPVKIVRGKDLNIDGGRRVTDYLVAGPKLPDGKIRSWASAPKLPMIDAASAPAALPAGNNVPEAAAH